MLARLRPALPRACPAAATPLRSRASARACAGLHSAPLLCWMATSRSAGSGSSFPCAPVAPPGPTPDCLVCPRQTPAAAATHRPLCLLRRLLTARRVRPPRLASLPRAVRVGRGYDPSANRCLAPVQLHARSESAWPAARRLSAPAVRLPTCPQAPPAAADAVCAARLPSRRTVRALAPPAGHIAWRPPAGTRPAPSAVSAGPVATWPPASCRPARLPAPSVLWASSRSQRPSRRLLRHLPPRPPASPTPASAPPTHQLGVTGPPPHPPGLPQDGWPARLPGLASSRAAHGSGLPRAPPTTSSAFTLAGPAPRRASCWSYIGRLLHLSTGPARALAGCSSTGSTVLPPSSYDTATPECPRRPRAFWPCAARPAAGSGSPASPAGSRSAGSSPSPPRASASSRPLLRAVSCPARLSPPPPWATPGRLAPLSPAADTSSAPPPSLTPGRLRRVRRVARPAWPPAPFQQATRVDSRARLLCCSACRTPLTGSTVL